MSCERQASERSEATPSHRLQTSHCLLLVQTACRASARENVHELDWSVARPHDAFLIASDKWSRRRLPTLHLRCWRPNASLQGVKMCGEHGQDHADAPPELRPVVRKGVGEELETRH